MQEKESAGEIILATPNNAPFHFTIRIKEDDKQCTFKITGADSSGRIKTNSYTIFDRDHTSYQNLFEKLSLDYGLRIPQNLQQNKAHDSTTVYHELLTENLVPEILYGYGDPAVLRVEQQNEFWYYLVTTSNDAADSFPICRSKDLRRWEFVNFVFPRNKKPKWAADGEFVSDYWAPEMHFVSAEYRIYFVAREKNRLDLSIGMARSKSPGGPFVADEKPLLKNNKIDPHVFVENNEAAFLYWKEDNNGVWPNLLIDFLYSNPQLINNLFVDKTDQVTASFIITLLPWIQSLKPMEAFLAEQIFIEAVTSNFFAFKKRLAAEMEKQTDLGRKQILSILEFTKTPVYAQKLSNDGSSLVEESTLVLENDLEWEAHLVEGIWVTKHNEKYYLFYSGNDFSTHHYGIGVAVADNPLGPFKKHAEPILKSTSNWWAPGHPSVAIAPDGIPHLFLHAFFPNNAGYKAFRSLLSVPLKFSDGIISID